MVDAYRQPYIPFYLTTREFFALVRDRLEPGGVVVVNAGHPEGSTQLEEMLAAGLRERVPARRPRPDHGVQHAADRARPHAVAPSALARRCPPSTRSCAPCSPRPRARLGPALEGGERLHRRQAPRSSG